MTAAKLHAARQLASHLRTRHPLPPPAWLSPKEAALFQRMPPPDQREGLAVTCALQAWGWGADRDLLLAGLLHDAGKSLAPASAAYRVLMTALDTLAPGLVVRLARRNPVVKALASHAASGARIAAEAGLPDGVTDLIAGHHQTSLDERMQALQRADALY